MSPDKISWDKFVGCLEASNSVTYAADLDNIVFIHPYAGNPTSLYIRRSTAAICGEGLAGSWVN